MGHRTVASKRLSPFVIARARAECNFVCVGDIMQGRSRRRGSTRLRTYLTVGSKFDGSVVCPSGISLKSMAAVEGSVCFNLVQCIAVGGEIMSNPFTNSLPVCVCPSMPRDRGFVLAAYTLFSSKMFF